MRDYKHLTVFPGEDKAVLENAKEMTGLSVNQLIIRAVHERVPGIVAEHQSAQTDLSPLPEADVAKAYARMSAEEIATDRELGRASLRAQKA